MNKILVTIGDSWVHGYIADPKHNNDFQIEKVFGDYLKEYMNYDEHINFGKSGSSSEYVLRKLTDFFTERYGEDNQYFVVVGITASCRYETYLAKYNQYISYNHHHLDDAKEQGFKNYNTEEKRQLFKAMYNLQQWTFDPDELVEKQFKTLLYTQLLLEKFAHNFVFFKSFEPYDFLPKTRRLLKLKHFYCLEDTMLNKLGGVAGSDYRGHPYNVNHKYFYPCGHPNEEGHEIMAKVIFAYIQQVMDR